MQGSNLSAVFGIAHKFHNSKLTNKNVSITSDGQYLYLYISQVQSASMFKIGTGMGNSVAGKVTQQVTVEKEGDLTWVYCQGKLYARRNNIDFGSLFVYDPKNFKKLGEARLICDDVFRGNKMLKKHNTNYPLLTDGESLYAILFTVERRERAVKPDMQEKLEALKTAKTEATVLVDTKKEISAELDAIETLKAAAVAARDSDLSSAAQLKEQVLKKMRNKSKPKKVDPSAQAKDDALAASKKASDAGKIQRNMQNYYVAVF